MERKLRRKLTQGEMRRLVDECLGDRAAEGSAEWAERVFRGARAAGRAGPQKARGASSLRRHGGAMVAPMPASVERIVGGDMLPASSAKKVMSEDVGQERARRCCCGRPCSADETCELDLAFGCLPVPRRRCCCCCDCCGPASASSQRVAMREIGMTAHAHEDGDDIDSDLGLSAPEGAASLQV